jgi:hypothetical protein
MSEKAVSMPMGIMEQLVHSTVRIECQLAGGQTSCGTGFFFKALDVGTSFVPFIVTNKHVIEGAEVGTFCLSLMNDKGEPDFGTYEKFVVNNFEAKCLKHPDPSIDLAAFPITELLQQIDRKGKTAFFFPLNKNFVPDLAERATFSVMEEVVMIGYPNALWDSVNNLPVVRRGVSASHIKTQWNGRDEFLTDIASFPGSSGSPVFVANIGSYTDPYGQLKVGANRIKLVGIHYAGAQHRVDGVIEIRKVQAQNHPVPVTSIPNNIGVVINSMRILDFEPLIRELVKPKKNYGPLQAMSINFGRP